MNGGWIQLAGPLSRMREFKFIETTQFNSASSRFAIRRPASPTRRASPCRGCSCCRAPPTSIPEFSWKYEIGPAGTTFVQGTALGPEYDGTLWIGSARSFSQVGANGGSLYRLKLTADRLHVDMSADPRLADRVADNLFRAQKFDGTESETLRSARASARLPTSSRGRTATSTSSPSPTTRSTDQPQAVVMAVNGALGTRTPDAGQGSHPL